MQVGHVFTIEPMICEGTPQVHHWSDEWTATTADGKRSATPNPNPGPNPNPVTLTLTLSP